MGNPSPTNAQPSCINYNMQLLHLTTFYILSPFQPYMHTLSIENGNHVIVDAIMHYAGGVEMCGRYRAMGLLVVAFGLGILLACIMPFAALVIVEGVIVLILGWLYLCH
ncbi:MAG: hypothetical protein H7Y41_04385 [Hyphomonadaceae bacterium]|nr:hypothetical protein [Clostridia bacterium]